MEVIKGKNLSIETLRGFAITIVVIGHIIGSAPDGGMKIEYSSFWRYIYLWIDYIQMPLYTAIAGWVYALKPVSSIKTGSFIFDKAKRILIPMACVSTLYFILQNIIPGTNNTPDFKNLLGIYVFPYTFFWYLQTLFLIFVFVVLTDKLKITTNFKGWVAMLALSYFMYSSVTTIIPYSTPNFFSFKGAMEQLPFFMIGLGIVRYKDAILKDKFVILYYILAIIGLIMLQAKWFCSNSINAEIYKIISPIWLLPTIVIILTKSFYNKYLIYIGSFAYSIYLFHGFGTAGGRIILSYIGIEQRVIVFLFALILSIGVPIIIDKILTKNRVLRFLFLGKK